VNDMWFAILRFFRKIGYLFHRDAWERELSEEMAFHADFKFRQVRETGLSEAEASVQSRRQMGNVILAAEESADVRSFMSLERLLQDVRYALRLLVRNPLFSLVAVLSLALGIGGNTAVYTMVNALLVKPLPFAEPDRLVRITESYPKALLVYFQQHSRTMDVAAISSGVEVNITGQGPAFRITASSVSANLFSLIGAPVMLGRGLNPGEDQPGRDRVAILSYDLWTSRFNSDPTVFGRMITVNGIQRRIIGVMPSGFALPSARTQLWYPWVVNPTEVVDYWASEFVPLIGRLHPGSTIEQAKNEVRGLAGSVWTMFPWPMPRRWNANSTVIPLQTDMAGDSRGRVLMLLCAVGAVLVIACANVAGLLMARAGARRKEIAVRAAMGAGRYRIVRQLLTECVVLAGAAGVVGLALGASALRLFGAVVSPDVATASRIQVDWHVAAFTASLSILAGLSFGFAPALSASRLSVIDAIKTGTQRSATGASIRFRSWLIGGEIALTLVLVVGASVLIQSLYKLASTNPGFHAQHIVAIKISPDRTFCSLPSACIAFYDRMLAQARQVPGVVDVALANTVPLDGKLSSTPVDVEDHPRTAEFPSPMFWAGDVNPGYLSFMSIPLLAGRAFTAADTRESEPVVLITASTARRFWPGQNAIGKHIRLVAEPRWRTIVGIVADIHQFSLTDRTPGGITGAMYMPYAQGSDGSQDLPPVMNLMARTASHMPQATDEIYRVASGMNPNIPVAKPVYLEEQVTGSVSKLRSTTWLFLSFAAAALALAAIGVYGLVSYSVTQRTYEIGLRMAIGADSGSIIHMIVGRSLRVALLGLAAGLIGAFILIRALPALMVDVAPADVRIYSGVALFLLCVTAAASFVPAWQASRIDPVRALRVE